MIEQVIRLLKGLIGLDVESVGQGVIERALRQRMKLLEMLDELSYWTLLQHSAPEQQALIEAVVVPETWFFRYPESFSALAVLARQRLTELRGSRPLRLLSLPCSTGEEPYSMVMALLDAGLAPSTFQVLALDISNKVLEQARAGIYGRNSFRGADQGFSERYFAATDGSLQLSPQVLAKVTLRCGNLLDEKLLTGEAAFDFVFCRNLLIYFDRATQQVALDALKNLLQEGGTLFVGPAEAGLVSQNAMQVLGQPLTFAFQRASAPIAPPARPLSVVKQVPHKPHVLPRVPAKARAVPSATPPATASLTRVAELANAGLSAEARLLCERYLAEYGASAEAFYWLGLLSDVERQPDAAHDFYRKALYLDPGHSEALAHLATLLAARGDHEGARRLQQRASRVGVRHDER